MNYSHDTEMAKPPHAFVEHKKNSSSEGVGDPTSENQDMRWRARIGIGPLTSCVESCLDVHRAMRL